MQPHTLPLLLVFVIALVSDGHAQTSTVAEIDALRAEIDALKADYDQRLQALERQFAALQSQAQPAPATQTPATTAAPPQTAEVRSEEHTSELQSRLHLVCRLLLEKKKR